MSLCSLESDEGVETYCRIFNDKISQRLIELGLCGIVWPHGSVETIGWGNVGKI